MKKHLNTSVIRICLGLIVGVSFLVTTGCSRTSEFREIIRQKRSETSEAAQSSVGISPAPGREYTAQTYCAVDDEDLIFDLSYPDDLGTGSLPLVVHVHGGAWTMGDRRGGAGTAFKDALLDAGYVYAAINYRLAPDDIFPAQIEDVKCAIRFFRANAEVLGIDPDRIAAMGGSAGGHLVTLLGLTAGQDLWEDSGGYPGVSSGVAAVVDLFGPSDLRLIANSLYRGTYEDVFGEAVYSEDAMWAFSPLAYVSEDAPPFLILHGDADQTVNLRQSENLQAALVDVGVPVEMVVVSGGGHGSTLFDEGAMPDLRNLTEILLDFLGIYLSVN